MHVWGCVCGVCVVCVCACVLYGFSGKQKYLCSASHCLAKYCTIDIVILDNINDITDNTHCSASHCLANKEYLCGVIDIVILDNVLAELASLLISA